MKQSTYCLKLTQLKFEKHELNQDVRKGIQQAITRRRKQLLKEQNF